MGDEDFELEPDDRRRFPRLRAPILYRDASIFGPRRPVLDASLGGVRIYSDDPIRLGRRLDVELLLPPAVPVRAVAKVAWVQSLSGGAPAAFEVGITFLSFPAEHVGALRAALESPEDSASAGTAG